MANLLGRMFNKQPADVAEDNSAINATENKDGLTGVARYLQQQQAAQQSTGAQNQETAVQQASDPAATGVAKYVSNIKTPILTGVSRYLIKQIIPEYQERAKAAAKAATPSGVEQYLAKVTAAANDLQPALPSGVEKYLSKLG